MMRAWACLFSLSACLSVGAQVRINELQCTRATASDGKGVNGDWVELYNAGKEVVDLYGYTLALNGISHRIEGPLAIPGRGLRVLWCDGRPDEGNDHLAFNLPRRGSSLLLIAPDRTTIMDLFHWPAMPPGVSIGRREDGGRAWGFFTNPTPGGPNAASAALVRCLSAPTITLNGQLASLASPEGAVLHYSIDGTLPGQDSPLYTSPITGPPGTVLRARAFATNAVPSPCAVRTCGLPKGALAVAVPPEDLLGPNGIADRASGNFARRGRAWQRKAWMQWGGSGEHLPERIGMAIAGSGSRGLPKKNFKLSARDRFGSTGPIALPDSSRWRNVMLRADATPNAFLRNLFMKEVVRRSGNHLDVQPCWPVPLYLNGAYHGLYRVMPSKGKQWAERLAGGWPVDLVEGPGAKAVSGSAKAYRRMVEAFSSGIGMDTMGRVADMASLIDLACLDLWTGRADHDLNVRCWRPRKPGGRWRWVLYDMDLWAPPKDRTVQRFCSEATPETPFVPQLLAHAATRNRLLARMSALLATILSPDRAGTLADSIFQHNRQAMHADFDRWRDSMHLPTPKAAYADLMDHVKGRAAPLLEQLAGHTGVQLRKLTVTVDPPQAGSVLVEGLTLTDDRRALRVFDGVPLNLAATPAPGMEFVGWQGGDGKGRQLNLTPFRDVSVKATFRPASALSQRRLQQGIE